MPEETKNLYCRKCMEETEHAQGFKREGAFLWITGAAGGFVSEAIEGKMKKKCPDRLPWHCNECGAKWKGEPSDGQKIRDMLVKFNNLDFEANDTGEQETWNQWIEEMESRTANLDEAMRDAREIIFPRQQDATPNPTSREYPIQKRYLELHKALSERGSIEYQLPQAETGNPSNRNDHKTQFLVFLKRTAIIFFVFGLIHLVIWGTSGELRKNLYKTENNKAQRPNEEKLDVSVHIEYLKRAKRSGIPIPPETTKWRANLSEGMKNALERILHEPEPRRTAGGLTPISQAERTFRAWHRPYYDPSLYRGEREEPCNPGLGKTLWICMKRRTFIGSAIVNLIPRVWAEITLSGDDPNFNNMIQARETEEYFAKRPYMRKYFESKKILGLKTSEKLLWFEQHQKKAWENRLALSRNGWFENTFATAIVWLLEAALIAHIAFLASIRKRRLKEEKEN